MLRTHAYIYIDVHVCMYLFVILRLIGNLQCLVTKVASKDPHKVYSNFKSCCLCVLGIDIQ